jgi:predicted 2-oxoglutarate/Fe(II)-dependent dioxygenase YbiX
MKVASANRGGSVPDRRGAAYSLVAMAAFGSKRLPSMAAGSAVLSATLEIHCPRSETLGQRKPCYLWDRTLDTDRVDKLSEIVSRSASRDSQSVVET